MRSMPQHDWPALKKAPSMRFSGHHLREGLEQNRLVGGAQRLAQSLQISRPEPGGDP
jgi:hypothetical protein